MSQALKTNKQTNHQTILGASQRICSCWAENSPKGKDQLRRTEVDLKPSLSTSRLSPSDFQTFTQWFWKAGRIVVVNILITARFHNSNAFWWFSSAHFTDKMQVDLLEISSQYYYSSLKSKSPSPGPSPMQSLQISICYILWNYLVKFYRWAPEIGPYQCIRELFSLV